VKRRNREERGSILENRKLGQSRGQQTPLYHTRGGGRVIEKERPGSTVSVSERNLMMK